MRIELGRQKSQNSTSIGRPRWITLTGAPAVPALPTAMPPPRAFTHARPPGNGGAAIESVGALTARERPRTPPGAAQRAPQPMLPTISSWIRRLSSTAYSIGSSFVTGSMKPFTIIAAASSSVKPREPM